MNGAFDKAIILAAVAFAIIAVAVQLVSAPRRRGKASDRQSGLADYGRLGMACLYFFALCLTVYVVLKITAPEGASGVVGYEPGASDARLMALEQRLAQETDRREESRAEILAVLKALSDRPGVVAPPANGGGSLVTAPPPSGWNFQSVYGGAICLGVGVFFWFGGWTWLKAMLQSWLLRRRSI